MLDQDILKGFKEESTSLLKELLGIIEKIESTDQKSFPANLLTDFAQKIDRIMGAAKTICMEVPEHMGLQKIGKLAELCKIIGYQAAESKNTALLPIFTAFWADTIEVMESLLTAFENEQQTAEITQSFSGILQKRLEWLMTRVEQDSSHATELLKKLGL